MVAEGFVRAAGDGTLLKLRVSPGAKTSSVDGRYGTGALKLKIAAPPVDGKANEEVRNFLAKLLDIPRSDVELIRGASGRDKTVRVRGVGPDAVEAALSSRDA